MNNKWLEASLFISALLSGFYGGIGFFTAIGGNPALRELSNYGFAEYWQHIDHYMGTRMPIFGPLLMLSLLNCIISLAVMRQYTSMYFIIAALLILVADLIFTLNVNHPLNKLIQSWDLQNLPSNVSEVKLKVVNAFNIRMLFMMASFVMVLISLYFIRRK